MNAVDIDCSECGLCCVHPTLVPIVFPHEMGNGYQTEVREAHGVKFHVIKKSGNNCTYYENGSCTIHPTRPLECRLYPAIPDLTQDPPHVTIDANLCPKEKFQKASFDPKVLRTELAMISVEPAWREAYNKLKR
jgi:Fe-S-cluster containining protein